MRRHILMAIVLCLSMMCAIAVPSRGTVIGIENAHATIDIPAGWNYYRNDTSTGSEADLLIQGPLNGGYRVVGLFGTDSWSGSVTNEKLYNELKKGVADAELTGVVYTVAPRNITIHGVAACDATLTATEGSQTIVERITVTASDGWNMEYILVFAGLSSLWSSYSSTVDACVNSLTIEPKSASSLGTTAIIIAVVVVIVIVVVVVVLLMRRKKPEPAMVPPPMYQTSPPVPPPSPPPST